MKLRSVPSGIRRSRPETTQRYIRLPRDAGARAVDVAQQRAALAGHVTRLQRPGSGLYRPGEQRQSQRDPATGAFLGEGTIILGGHVNEVAWESVVTAVLPGADGSLALTSSHHIWNEGGSIDFTTEDAVLAIPTSVPGEYTFTSHLDVRDGEGRVKEGFIVVEGWVDLVRGQVVLGPSSGVLCARR